MSTATQTMLPGELFELSDLGVAVLDAENRVSWINDRLLTLTENDAPALLGRNADELPQQAAKLLFGEPPLINLLSNGDPVWLIRLANSHGDNTLLIFQDISEQQRLAQENQRLRQQVDDLKLNDDLTGLPNRRAISQALELQISRSRRYQNPLSIVFVHLGLEDEQIHALHAGVEPLVLGVSRYLRDRLRWVDQIGRWDDNIFILVLPETGQEETDGLVEKIRNEQTSMVLPEPFDKVRPTLSFGTAYWQKGDDMRVLLRRATEQLAAG